MSSNYCQQHEGQELVLYCETCSKTLCIDCTIDTTEHTEHCCGYIKKYRKEFHEVLDRNRTFVDSLSKTLTEIEETRTNVLQEKTVIAQDIENEIDRRAAKQKVRVQSQLASISNGVLARLQTQHDHLSRVYSQVIESLQKAERIVENTPDSEFALVRKTVEQLKEVAEKARDIRQVPTELVDPHFVLQMHRDEIHLYSGEPADPSKCTFSRESTKNVQIDEPVSISINVFTSDDKPCLGKQSVTVELHCIRELSMKLLEARCLSPRQYQVDFTPKNRGRHMLAIKVNGRHIFGSPIPMFVIVPPYKLTFPIAVIPGLKRPAGLHNCNRKILACEMGKDRIVEIDKNCQVVHTFANVENGPNELCSDSSSNIYLTTYHDNCLHKLNGYGEILKTVGSTGTKKEEFQFSNGVNMNISGDLLYVCDTNNHRIKVYDLQLNLIDRDTIEEVGTELGQFKAPGDLAFDKDGYMYVAEQDNNRIQVFSPDKKPLRTHPMEHPITVHVLNDHLYVTQGNKGCVTVIRTTGHFIASFGIGHLQFPEGLEIDDDGFVYVTSHQSNILVF